MDNMFVQAGETVMVLEPSDSFYLFNKSLAVFSFFAFWIFRTTYRGSLIEHSAVLVLMEA